MLRCYYYSMYCYAFRCYSAAHNSFGVDLPPTFRYFWQGDLTEEHMLVSSSSSSMYVSGAIEQRRLNAHRLRACVYPLSRYEFNWELAKPVSQYPLMVEYWQTPSNFSYTVGYQWIDDWKKNWKYKFACSTQKWFVSGLVVDILRPSNASQKRQPQPSNEPLIHMGKHLKHSTHKYLFRL